MSREGMAADFTAVIAPLISGFTEAAVNYARLTAAEWAQHRLVLLVVTGDQEHDSGEGIASKATEEHTQ